jgi:hypothetical protein
LTKKPFNSMAKMLSSMLWSHFTMAPRPPAAPIQDR